ncbi:hypothetical protein ZIOFF_032372 [Zingiber officinale]|uniref:Agenet domain-containing protein n=2 Tax=Zingiber officinale TaxID=94328 RepID=A0A8J5GGC5_ZINOF|nr:hypothetical protein ZIOFF_032372 [Zingiber officinale]
MRSYCRADLRTLPPPHLPSFRLSRNAGKEEVTLPRRYQLINGSPFHCPFSAFGPIRIPSTAMALDSGGEKKRGDRRRSVWFQPGDPVEVRSDDDGFLGAWYEATAASSLPQHRVEIVYSSLVDDDDPSLPLREIVLVSQLRPRPPPTNPSRCQHGLHDLVEAFHQDGWWAGVISAILHTTGRYIVAFPTSREELEFDASEIRSHLEWTDRHWVPFGDVRVEEAEFAAGARIEVSRNLEIGVSAWFSASVTQVLSISTYLIEYESLTSVTTGELLAEFVDVQYIRPCQLNAMSVKDFAPRDEVEVPLHGGWVPGEISKILKESRCIVKVRDTRSVTVFNLDQLRHSQCWDGHRWVFTFQQKTRKSQGSSVSGNRNPQNQKRCSLLSSSAPYKGEGEASSESGGFKLNQKHKKANLCSGPSQNSKKLKKDKSRCDHVRPQCDLMPEGPSTPLSDIGICSLVQETRRSQGSSVSVKRSPRGQKRCSLLSSLPPSKCEGEVTSELGGLKLNLKHKKANLQSGPSQGSKMFKKAKSQYNHVMPQHQLISQGPSTPMFVIDICSSMPPVDPSSSTISPSSRGTIAELDASIRDVPGLSIEEEGLANASHQLSKHQPDVTEVDGTPMGYKANDHLHLLEWMNYNLDYALNTKVKKKRTKLVAKSRKLQKNFSNDGVLKQLQDGDSKMLREEQMSISFSHLHAPVRMNINNIEKSDTNQVVLSNYSRANDDLSDQDLYSAASQPITQQNKLIMYQGSPSSADIEDIEARCVICMEGLSENNLTGSFFIPKFLADVTLNSVNDAASNEIYNNVTVHIQSQIAPSVLAETCTEIAHNQTQSKVVALEGAAALIVHSSGSLLKDIALPFSKTSCLWKQIESMEIFQVMPQQPHFCILEQYTMELREGMAIGLMVSFANLATDIQKLHIDRDEASLDAKMKALYHFESNGFSVDFLRARLEKLRELQIYHKGCLTRKAEVEGKIIAKMDDKSMIDSQFMDLDRSIKNLREYLACFQERKDSAMNQINRYEFEIAKLKIVLNEVEEAKVAGELKFSNISSAPW